MTVDAKGRTRLASAFNRRSMEMLRMKGIVLMVWASALVLAVVAYVMDTGSESTARAAAGTFVSIGNPDSVSFRGVHRTHSNDVVCGEIVFQEKGGGWSGWQPFVVKSGVMTLLHNSNEAGNGACSKG